MYSFVVPSPVVQACKGAIAAVTRVTFSGGHDDRPSMSASVCVMGRPRAVCVASGTCAMCRRRGKRVHDVLWVWGHVIIRFDRRPRTRGRGSRG